MRLPDFLIIGAHKAGTTSLYHYLKSHPQVYMPELKEARYFAFNPQNSSHLEKAKKAFPITTMEEYLALFLHAKNESLLGEASPNYLVSEYAAHNIYKHIPKVKLIVSLRNPIDRAYSLFQMNYRSHANQSVDIKDYKLSRCDAEKNSYCTKLKVYFDLFDNDQIKIILFEDLVNDTEKVVKEIFRFLEVPDSFSPVVPTIHNRGGLPKFRAIHNISKNKLLQSIAHTCIPQPIISALKDINSKNMGEAPKLTKDQRFEALKLVKEDIYQLEKLLQRDLSAWYVI